MSGVFSCSSAWSRPTSLDSVSPPRLQRRACIATTKAVNYRLRGDAVKVDFHGTELMQNASGEAKVTGKKSSVEIDAKFEGLDDPTKFGLEYLSARAVGSLARRPRSKPGRTGDGP